MNYYIVVPSAASFCHELGIKSTYSPILIGTANIATFVTIIWHAHVISDTKANDNLSLRYNLRSYLLLAASFGFVGNILYSLAHQIDFLPAAFLGRFVVGLSSSEIINKHFVAVSTPVDTVVKETAALRKAHMKGMLAGAVCGAAFEAVDGDAAFFVGRDLARVVDFEAVPGYFMSLLWFVQIVGLSCSETGNRPVPDPSGGDDHDDYDDDDYDYDDYDYDDYGNDDLRSNKSPSASFSRSHYTSEVSSVPGLHTPPLVGDTGERSVAESVDSGNRRSEILVPKRRKRSLTSTLKRIQKLVFLNNALPVTLVSLLVSTITIEIIFSSCVIMTHRYFVWSSSLAGLFLVTLTFLIYPIYRATSYWSRCRDERTVMKKSLSGILIGIIIFVNYGELIRLFFETRNIFRQETEPYSEPRTKYDWRFGRVQYCVGVTVIFICCIALEGVTLSLLSKVSHPRLNVSTFNCSVIVPLLICLGRIFGDAILLSVSISHRIINTDVVNSVSFVVLCLCWPCLHLVKKYFFYLNGS